MNTHETEIEGLIKKIAQLNDRIARLETILQEIIADDID